MNTKIHKKVSAGILTITLLAMNGTVFSRAQASVNDWQKGVSIQPRWNTDFGSDSFKQSVRNAASLHANYITLIVPIYQSNTGSADIQRGWNTPTDESLAAGINFVHSLGLKVNMKPHLDTYDGQWRANINAGDRNSWFTNYENMIRQFVTIAANTGVEEITIGSELINMATFTSNQDNTNRWRTIIRDMRALYGGKLTYSANWGAGDFATETTHIGFWDALDYVGISGYYNLDTGANDVGSLKAAWGRWEGEVSGLASQFGKPVLFTEIGYRSVDNAHREPWNSSLSGGVNLQEQVNTYEAMFSFWNDRSYIAGVQLWDWSSDPNAGGQFDSGYIPQHKPAESVINRWFGNTAPTPSPTQTPTPGPTTFQSLANVTPSTVQPGGSITINATVTNSGANDFSGAIVDIEVYNSQNTKVHQHFVDNTSFRAGESRNFQTVLSLPNQGTYNVRIGVFSSNWSVNNHWNGNAATFTVSGSGTPTPTPTVTPTSTPTPTPPPNNSTINIWWPTNGVTVNGVQPFKGMVEGRDINQYNMFWQVDGDRLNSMGNSNVDWPHKEALVDLSGWTWNTNGLYHLNFVAKDFGGVLINQRSIDIHTK